MTRLINDGALNLNLFAQKKIQITMNTPETPYRSWFFEKSALREVEGRWNQIYSNPISNASEGK